MKNTMILVVENDPNEAELTLRALRKNIIRNEIFVAQDGVEAVDFLFCRNQYADRDPDELPQLILLDLKLPKLNGLEVLRYIRANERTNLIPVVILTSSDEERDLRDGYKSGANSYIRKPVDFNQFEDYVKQLGSYWLTLNQTPPR